MATSLGVDYLDRNIKDHLDIPKKCFFDREDSSSIGLMFELFSQTGTSTWVSLWLAATGVSISQCNIFADWWVAAQEDC
jgi:hypothetical protein